MSIRHFHGYVRSSNQERYLNWKHTSESLSIQMLFKAIGLNEIIKEWGNDRKEKIRECVLGNFQMNRPGRRGRTEKEAFIR